MTDDIVTRLREAEWNENPNTNVRLCADAAEEIERLRAELADYKRTVRALEAELAEETSGYE